MLLAIVSVALAVQGAAISTPSTQDVRLPTVPTDLVIPPKAVSHPPAVYSDEARQRGIEGTVVVQASFDADGNITVLSVVKGLGYGLDEAALAALKAWRFSPARRDGLPVSAIAEVEVPFRLSPASGEYTFSFEFSFGGSR